MRRIVTILVLICVAASAVSVMAEKATYDGILTVFVTEPQSRYWDANGFQYNHGFLDIVMEEPITLPDNGRWDHEIVWNGAAAGFADVDKENVEVIAVIHRLDSVENDAWPPYGFYFYSHYADAAAMARPEQIGFDQAVGGYTHTVLVEAGMSTG